MLHCKFVTLVAFTCLNGSVPVNNTVTVRDFCLQIQQ